MTTDKPAGEMPDDETPAAWWVRFPDGSGCIYEDKAYADSYAAQVSYRTVTVIPVYTRADKPDAFTVSEEQWNRLQEILDAPAKDLTGLRKLLNTPSVFDKPDAAAAREALEALNELIAITEDSYSGHERAVQLGQIIKLLLQRVARV